MPQYQPLGDLRIAFEGCEGRAGYRRELNIDTAIARVSYRSRGRALHA
jgi:alpha-L-fucosidase 2